MCPGARVASLSPKHGSDNSGTSCPGWGWGRAVSHAPIPAHSKGKTSVCCYLYQRTVLSLQFPHTHKKLLECYTMLMPETFKLSHKAQSLWRIWVRGCPGVGKAHRESLDLSCFGKYSVFPSQHFHDHFREWLSMKKKKSTPMFYL